MKRLLIHTTRYTFISIPVELDSKTIYYLSQEKREYKIPVPARMLVGLVNGMAGQVRLGIWELRLKNLRIEGFEMLKKKIWKKTDL